MKRRTDAETRRVGYLAVDLIAKHLSELDHEPVFTPVPRELAEGARATSAPLTGASADDILREFSETVEPDPFGNGHPRCRGGVNSPPAVIGVFAEALAAAMNPSPAATRSSRAPSSTTASFVAPASSTTAARGGTLT